MKIYQIRAPKGKLKYYEEHIHYTLDGSDKYIWREIQKQINNFEEELTIITPLTFVTSKCKFKDLDKYQWLKTDFRLPIMNKLMVEKLVKENPIKHRVFPVIITDSKNPNLINENFVAFYLLENFDCVDWSKTKLVEVNDEKYFDYKEAVYKDDLIYPLIFKIKGMKINLTHYVAEVNKKRLQQIGIDGIEYQKAVGI